jgi:hypothetical protein
MKTPIEIKLIEEKNKKEFIKKALKLKVKK